jgi:hypothetical protein
VKPEPKLFQKQFKEQTKKPHDCAALEQNGVDMDQKFYTKEDVEHVNLLGMAMTHVDDA